MKMKESLPSTAAIVLSALLACEPGQPQSTARPKESSKTEVSRQTDKTLVEQRQRIQKGFEQGQQRPNSKPGTQNKTKKKGGTGTSWSDLRHLSVDELLKDTELAWQEYTKGVDPKKTSDPLWNVPASPYYNFAYWSHYNKGRHDDIMRLANVMVGNNRPFYLGGVLVNTELTCNEFNGLKNQITDFRAIRTIEISQDPNACADLTGGCEFDFFEMEKRCQ